MFQNASNFRINGSTFINISGKTGTDKLLDYTIAAAAYDSYVAESKASCLEGTRAQYIDDITAWTTGLIHLPQRLLWMYGPAGVGKSAVAKSYASKTALHGMLGASFFFSRDNDVDDPSHFFTTIAYQIGFKFPQYKEIIDSNVEVDPTLVQKGLEVQFYELIIAPFLNLPVSMPHKATVFIDGLDECKGDLAQSKILELVADSIVRYGDRIPLMWVFFSRPEHHINVTFSRYSNSPVFRRVELPVSRDHGADIRLYLRSTLELSTFGLDDGIHPRSLSVRTVWPSDEDLDILVKMAAGLFIYAATVAKFIMDPNPLSPQRQLKEVLRFYRRTVWKDIPEPNADPPVIIALDAFYSMIMSRIPPKLLPTIQQILLINNSTTVSKTYSEGPDEYPTTSKKRPPIRIPANIFGLDLQEFASRMSRLCSVLTLQQNVGSDESWFWEDSRDSITNERWPGSARILIYHASFMEFLLDQERSKEFWIEDECHYSEIAVKGMDLWREMYTMNGCSCDERIQGLREILSVFPEENLNLSRYLWFQNELFYEFLCWCALSWCTNSGSTNKVMDLLRELFDLVEFRNFFDIQDKDVKLLPEDKYPHTIFKAQRPDLFELKPIDSPYPLCESHQPASVSDIPPSIKETWASITSLVQAGEENKLYRLINTACRDTDCLAYIQSQVTYYSSQYIQLTLDRAKKLDFDAMNGIELLDYYSYEWSEYKYGLNDHLITPPKGFPTAIKHAALLPWLEVFTLIEGENRRLTKATKELITQMRNGDLVPYKTSNYPPSKLLQAFCTSVAIISTSLYNDPSASASVGHTHAELLRASKAYYMAEQGFLPNDTAQFCISRVMDRVREELYNNIFFSMRRRETERASAEIMLEGHLEELDSVFEEILQNKATDNLLRDVRYLIRLCPDAASRLTAKFKAYVKMTTLTCVARLDKDASAGNTPSGEALRAAVLLEVKEEQMKKAEWLSPGRPGKKGVFCEYVDQVFDELFTEHPEWHDAVKRLIANPETHPSQTQSLKDVGTERSSSAQSAPEPSPAEGDLLKPADQLPQLQLSQSTDHVDTSTPNPTSNTLGETDRPIVFQASLSSISPPNQLAPPTTENIASKKKGKVFQLFRRSFRKRG